MPTINDAVFSIELDLVGQVVDSVANANTHTARQVVAFAEILERKVAGVGSKLLDVHAKLAKGAQEATVAAYTAAISVRNTPAYRTIPRDDRNKRYAGGFLLSALLDPSFSVATEDGIIFANTEVMNERAKQWHRLNYGAGSAAGTPARTFSITWSNLVVASIGLEDEASPPFRLPKGFWLDASGHRVSSKSPANEFYPVGEVPRGRMADERNRRPSPARNTRGIAAQRWLDAGVEYIANNLTREYERIYTQMYREAVRESSGRQIEGITSRSVRPWGRLLSSRVITTPDVTG